MADVVVERIDELSGHDMHDLCEAAEDAIAEGGGFGWVAVPPRESLEIYWRGVMLVPERVLFVGRLDGVIAGSAQLLKPPRNNEAQSHAVTLTTMFVAPWARGHRLGYGLIEAVEAQARADGYHLINLDVRASQITAIARYDSLGYVRWAEHPYYARVNGAWVAGYYYYKDLKSEEAPA